MAIDPASLKIRIHPDPVLRVKASPIESFDEEVSAVAARMVELMFEADGIGLAAPQVGVSWRMFVAHVPQSEAEGRDEGPTGAEGANGEGAEAVMRFTEEPVVYINPVISRITGTIEAGEEGCLSLPKISGEVMRPPTVTITARDLEGREFSQRGTGLLARCWQHETDHLDGVLIIDKMTQMSRLRVRSAVRELERRGGAR